MAKIFLADVTLQTDLTNISETVPYTFINSSNQGYDTSYIEYLRYALAQYMCSEYGIIFNPESRKLLSRIEHQLLDVSPPDLSLKKVSILTQGTGINFGDVNLGLGYRPFGS